MCVTSAYSLKNPQMLCHTLGRVVLEIIKRRNKNCPVQWRNGEKRMYLWFCFFCKTLFWGQHHCITENNHQTWKEMVSHSCHYIPLRTVDVIALWQHFLWSTGPSPKDRYVLELWDLWLEDYMSASLLSSLIFTLNFLWHWHISLHRFMRRLT